MKRSQATILKLLTIVLLTSSCKEEPTPMTEANNPEVNSMLEDVKNKHMRSFIISHRGNIEGEYLFDSKENTGYDLRSATKSITTTLIGIAIDKGYIKSEYETIGQYIEPLIGPIQPDQANLRIFDLMTMTAGGKDEFLTSTEYFRWLNAPEHLKYIFTTSLTEPRGKFIYNNELMYLLSVIIHQTTGMSEKEFARIHLFEPMGIKSRGWEVVGDYNNGGAGLQLSANEMTKIGELYLNKGVYNGTRIVSEEWISKVLTPRVATIGYGDYHYGFGWWLGTTTDSVRYAYALGWAGQFIFVVPELDLTVTASHTLRASETESVNNTINTREFVVNRIIKYYKDSGN
jgi:CubicO group peptidase (beta-lactamase class C family)